MGRWVDARAIPSGDVVGVWAEKDTIVIERVNREEGDDTDQLSIKTDDLIVVIGMLQEALRVLNESDDAS